MSHRAYAQGRHEGQQIGLAEGRQAAFQEVLEALAAERRSSNTLTIDLMGLDRAGEIVLELSRFHAAKETNDERVPRG